MTTEQKTPNEEDDWDKEVAYESGKEDDEDEDDEDMKDPIIRQAVETAKKVQMAMKAARAAHQRLPISERPCCGGSGSTTVIIKDLDGIKESIKVDLSISVATLLKCRCLYSGYYPEQLRVIHKGSSLIRDKSLQSQNIKHGDTIHFILQMYGS